MVRYICRRDNGNYSNTISADSDGDVAMSTGAARPVIVRIRGTNISKNLFPQSPGFEWVLAHTHRPHEPNYELLITQNSF